MATVSNVVRGAGLLTDLWKKLEAAVYAAGGTDEHLARLVKADGDPLIAKFGEMIVATIRVFFRLVGNFATFSEAIRAGHYDYLFGFANNSEQIEGQVCHPVDREVELDHPGVTLTTQQVYDRYKDRMASLSELLQFGIDNPNIQLQFPIEIVWQDETGQFWFADLLSDGSHRELDVHRARPDDQWHDDYRFLVRK